MPWCAQSWWKMFAFGHKECLHLNKLWLTVWSPRHSKSTKMKIYFYKQNKNNTKNVFFFLPVTEYWSMNLIVIEFIKIREDKHKGMQAFFWIIRFQAEKMLFWEKNSYESKPNMSFTIIFYQTKLAKFWFVHLKSLKLKIKSVDLKFLILLCSFFDRNFILDNNKLN